MINFGAVTAIMKQFIERLICFAYWPWGSSAPKIRDLRKEKRAVVVASSAAPEWMSRLFTKTVGLLKNAAGLLGAKTIGVLFIGLAAGAQRQRIGKKAGNKARRLGKMLAGG